MRTVEHLARRPRPSASPRPPRWPHRVVARLRGPTLDRQLAAGVATWHSPVHAARTLQLTSAHSRRTLAVALERLVEHAEEPPSRFRSTAVVPPCREQVRDAWPVILAVSARLRDGAPLGARGAARLRELLSDGAGPCYTRRHRSALTLELQLVSQWLDTQH